MTQTVPAALDARPPRERPPTVTLEVFPSFEAAAPHRGAWDACAVACGGSVYHAYVHAAVWWTHYGDGRAVRLLVFRAGGETVGVLPFFVERRWIGPVPLRVAALVGSDSTTAVLEPPLRADAARQVLGSALRHLLEEERCDVVRFAPLGGTWPHADALRAAVADLRGRAEVVRDVDAGPHSVFELPSTFDAWFASLDKRRRGDHRRATKALAAEHALTWDVVDEPAALERELPRFRAMHETQWRAEGRLGHFGDWPRAGAYHESLVRAHGATGRAHLVRMLLDGDVVASQLCYGLGPTLHWVLPARAVRPDLERFSLGRMGVVQLVEFAVARGYRRIEAGAGRYDYKLQLGAREHAQRSILVAAARPGARARLALFARGAALLDAAYYRGWYLKLAPRLPLPRRPLATFWIRSRL